MIASSRLAYLLIHLNKPRPCVTRIRPRAATRGEGVAARRGGAAAGPKEVAIAPPVPSTAALAPCGAPRPDARRWLPRFHHVAAVVSVLSLALFSFLAGAAAMQFSSPFSNGMKKALIGGQAWFSGPAAPADARQRDWTQAAVVIDRPAETYDGFTLCTATQAAEAVLINMRGEVVHRWKMSDRRPWRAAGDVADPRPDEPIHWERCHLYPNGDLLALCCKGPGSPYGYGLAKFDRDSKLLWGYSAPVHHDFDVGEDGCIYVLTQRLEVEPPAGLESLPSPCVAEELAMLSPEGQVLQMVPLLEAFRDSPYVVTLLSSNEADAASPFPSPQAGGAPFPPPGPPGGLPQPPGVAFPTEPGDVLHPNSVKVLSPKLAPKFPLFKAGQVLLSFRSPSALAVLDLRTRSMAWAARGVWRCQHDARFLDDGGLLVFDNLGWPHGSRVVEYDPVTQAIPWAYGFENAGAFSAAFRGCAQRLPNGNSLLVDPGGCRVLEVSEDREVVWQWGCPAPAAAKQGDAPDAPNLTGARRYGPDELPFLKGMPDVRPR
jgi:hypothetical protein